MPKIHTHESLHGEQMFCVITILNPNQKPDKPF